MKEIIYTTFYFIHRYMNEFYDEMKFLYFIPKFLYRLNTKEKQRAFEEKADSFAYFHYGIEANGLLFSLISLFVFGITLFIDSFLNLDIKVIYLYVFSFLSSFIYYYMLFNFETEYLEYKKEFLIWNKKDERKKYIRSVGFIFLLLTPLFLWVLFFVEFQWPESTDI